MDNLACLYGRLRRVLPLLVLAALAIPAAVQPASAERIERTINVGGLEREYIAHIPPGAGRGAPVSAVFAFHPGVGSASGFERATRLHEAPGAQNFVIVYPDGYYRSWNAGHCCGRAKTRGVDEISFVQAIFEDLSRSINIHPSRNFATGFSNGAMLSHELACRMSHRFAAIAVVGGTRDFGRGCAPTRPISVFFMHGLEDEVVPFGGGRGGLTGNTVHASVPSNVSFWARFNRCGQPQPAPAPGGLSCERYTGCAGGAKVVSCPIPDMGHAWPGERVGAVGRAILGRGRSDLPGSAAVLEFFRSVP